MERDTEIGGPGDRFPATHHSAVVAARSDDPEKRARALGALIDAYWKPTYKYVRVKWNASSEDAKDLTQGLFTRALEKGWFARYDATKGTFRTYLRVCIDGFVSNERKAARRVKRGAGLATLPLDFETAEGELMRHDVADEASPDLFFEREWARALFGLAIDALRERLAATGRATHFALFQRYDIDSADCADGERPTYEALAAEHALSVTQVTNYLAAARRAFRSIVLEQLREITGSDAEFRDEARRLLGVDP